MREFAAVGSRALGLSTSGRRGGGAGSLVPSLPVVVTTRAPCSRVDGGPPPQTRFAGQVAFTVEFRQRRGEHTVSRLAGDRPGDMNVRAPGSTSRSGAKNPNPERATRGTSLRCPQPEESAGLQVLLMPEEGLEPPNTRIMIAGRRVPDRRCKAAGSALGGTSADTSASWSASPGRVSTACPPGVSSVSSRAAGSLLRSWAA